MKRATKVALVLLLPALFILAPHYAHAITVLQVRAAVEARLATIWPGIQTAMAACLENQEDCYTTWSIGGTGATADLCNTVTADSSVCTMAQTDPGVPDACGIATGTHKFSDYGITLDTPDIMAYKMNSYSTCVPQQTENCRGAQICARLKFNGNSYERCYAMGPQAAAFTDSVWRTID